MTPLVAASVIDGAVEHSADSREIRDPGDRDSVLGLVRLGTTDTVGRAVDSAEKAAAEWGSNPAPKRGKVLFEAAQRLEVRKTELASLLTREEGKTLGESLLEVDRAINLFRFYGAICFKLGGKTLPSNDPNSMVYTLKEPLGVVGLITPWNFPLSIPAWKIAPALAAGDAVVFKPASQTPLIATELVNSLHAAGLPKGVLNMVVGSGPVVGGALAASSKIHALSFTGSSETGRSINAAACSRMLRMQLELGGKNALVIMDDADVALGVDLAIKGAFGLTGQACTATSRLLIQESIADSAIEKLVGRASAVVVGHGLEKGVEMGPLASEDQFDKVRKYIEIGRLEAELVTGGAEPKKGKEGFYLSPTVFNGVSPEDRIFKEEIFGPVLSVATFHDLDEAVRLVNSVAYGLTAGIVTRSQSNASKFINKADVGVVKVNKPLPGLELQAPYGGFKESGNDQYKEMGEEAVDFYTRTKAVYVGY
ncbi:MAG TPA: aldehyde dehydrogenase family protein [Nitrososphaerales archaeon]|nr:aldehyde dehydrogenase family protein [Nitrososphaerales archaeon]